MGRLQTYQKFPLNIYYRISVELGLPLLTRTERIFIYFYLALLLHSFVRSIYNMLMYIYNIKPIDILDYLSTFYK